MAGRPRIMLRYDAVSEAGRAAGNNADSAFARPNLLAISDGTAGRRVDIRTPRDELWARPFDLTGELSSAVVVNAISEIGREVPADTLEAVLRRAVARANAKLLKVRTERPEHASAGASLTALLWSGNRFVLTHIGDSRGYLLRTGELYQLTRDHTANSLGQRTSNVAHVVYRLLDGGEDREPDVKHRQALLGDRYLLTTNGLTDVVDAQVIYGVLAAEESPSSACLRLVHLAEDGGAPDNVTCVVADVVTDPDAKHPPIRAGAAALGWAAGLGGPLMGPAEITMPPRPGLAVGDPLAAGDPEQLGRYRILRVLGQGGQGRVYLARSPGGSLVAVKVIPPWLADQPGFRTRLAREAAAARAVSGAFTAPVIDADPDGDPPWLVTGYVPGHSLMNAVSEHGPLPVRTLERLMAGLAEALVHIHGAGLVHRDLKPSNVLLAPDGPRVIDFGIVRAVGDTGGLTKPGTVIGTPQYMSPEQIKGGYVETAADVFSLGSVLFFAATGRPPFGTGPQEALTYQIVHTEPDLVAAPRPLRPVLAECLRKDPARRPAPTRILDLLESRISRHASDEPWLPPPLRH